MEALLFLLMMKLVCWCMVCVHVCGVRGLSLAEGQLNGILTKRKRSVNVYFSEPPVLLATAAFSNRSDDTRLHNLILSCVAYGEPLPQIEWLWRTDNNTAFPLREHSDNFSTATTNITTTLENYDIVSLVSVLLHRCSLVN